MNTPVKICLASALALATAMPALGQSYSGSQYQPSYDNQYQPSYGAQNQPSYDNQYQPSYGAQSQQTYGSPYQQTQQSRDDAARYENDRAAYEDRRDAYDASRAAYDNNSAAYRAARADYERRHADWLRARADYDARYGYGAYVRVYGAEPVWDDSRWTSAAPSTATTYGRDTAYTAAAGCRPTNNNAVAGGIIGALAGAALGSNIAANGRGTEGTVLGAVVGGGIGASIGNARDKYQCDQRGPYYSYNDTVAYREDPRVRSGRYNYAYYQRMRCRLAPAPVDNDGQDYRYVRVCPDSSGRYRITG